MATITWQGPVPMSQWPQPCLNLLCFVDKELILLDYPEYNSYAKAFKMLYFLAHNFQENVYEIGYFLIVSEKQIFQSSCQLLTRSNSMLHKIQIETPQSQVTYKCSNHPSNYENWVELYEVSRQFP